MIRWSCDLAGLDGRRRNGVASHRVEAEHHRPGRHRPPGRLQPSARLPFCSKSGLDLAVCPLVLLGPQFCSKLRRGRWIWTKTVADLIGSPRLGTTPTHPIWNQAVFAVGLIRWSWDLAAIGARRRDGMVSGWVGSNTTLRAGTDTPGRCRFVPNPDSIRRFAHWCCWDPSFVPNSSRSVGFGPKRSWI